MHLLIRRLGALFAGAALAVALTASLVGQAKAAQPQFQLHTQANILHSMADVSGFAFSPSTLDRPEAALAEERQGPRLLRAAQRR